MFISINNDSISSFIGLIISLTFAVFYLTSFLIVKKDRLQLIISMFMFSLAVYLGGYAMYSSHQNSGGVLFWTRVCYSGGTIIILTGYILSSEILELYSSVLNRIIPAAVLLLISAIIFPTELIFTNILNPVKTHSSVIKGPLFPYLLLLILLTQFLLLIRFVVYLLKDKEKVHLMFPILFAMLFWFFEAAFDGIFGAILSLINKKYSIGPFVLIFSLALNSSRFTEKRNRELIRIKEENRKISESLIFDNLSGLYSRDYFLQTLKQRVALNHREEVSDCLMFIDVDQFKTVNDELGHDMGDRLIVFLGEVLKRHSRETDICARYGGDEFLILLENCNSGDCIQRADNIREKFLEELPEILNHWNGCGKVSLSIGVVDYQYWSDDYTEIIKRADLAMYEAKRSGKSISILYSPAIDSTFPV